MLQFPDFFECLLQLMLLLFDGIDEQENIGLVIDPAHVLQISFSGLACHAGCCFIPLPGNDANLCLLAGKGGIGFVLERYRIDLIDHMEAAED